MPAFVTFGRVLFAVLFIVSGASKLFDLTTTAQTITDKVVLPAAFATYTAQIEGATGMPMAQLLAIAAGSLELVGGLLIALNFGARFFDPADPLRDRGDLLFPRFLEPDRSRGEEQHDSRPEEPVADRRPVHHRRYWAFGARSRAGLYRADIAGLLRSAASPRRHTDVVSGIEDFNISRLEAMCGQHFLRRPLRHSGKAGLAAA